MPDGLEVVCNKIMGLLIKNMSCSKWILFIGLLFCTSLLSAQGTVEDYRRAYSLGSKFSAKKVYYSNVNPNWIQGTHSFWYVKNTEQGPLCDSRCGYTD